MDASYYLINSQTTKGPEIIEKIVGLTINKIDSTLNKIANSTSQNTDENKNDLFLYVKILIALSFILVLAIIIWVLVKLIKRSN
jgi:hypothetical protein